MPWLLVLLLVAGCARAPTGIEAVERFAADVALAPDGSIQVRETIDVRVRRDERATFAHRIAGGRADGFLGFSASMDGRGDALGGRTGQTVIESGGTDLSIFWDIAPVPAPQRALEAHYRALGVVEIQGMRGTFSWPVFPSGRTYDIQSAHVSLTLPPGTRVLRGPTIDDGGWQWTTTANALVATKSSIARTERGILTVELALDAVPMLEPRWQTRAALGQQLTPSFIAAGLFILVTGAGILWAIRLQYFRAPRNADVARASAPRDVIRGLRTAGWVVVVLGLGAAIFAFVALRSLGLWPQAVPISFVLVGLLFVAASSQFSR